MKILSILFAVFFINTTSENITVENIRDAYKVCNQSREHADKFFELTEKATENKGAIYLGYYGAALALKASYSWNPISKMSYFNKARKTIDAAIQAEPDNIELRMIRSSIQTNVPKILGYHKNIEEDRDFILNNLENVDTTALKEYIEGYIEYSDVFSKP
ncbi:hypothetical protein U6A24_10565 [Aquimarina gracilis]|uniref:Uncharacterized protein n=1 Tax=Aquimarina gracilis TaxID=874422 RepID=A0ABU5ZV56_9FLAO|nr:hypothetical protein [Aquimarina gracilis]MEB3345908.1 hypothetical protein [Aquimarina gracilis]